MAKGRTCGDQESGEEENNPKASPSGQAPENLTLLKIVKNIGEPDKCASSVVAGDDDATR